jgi:hypothetical protein
VYFGVKYMVVGVPGTASIFILKCGRPTSWITSLEKILSLTG